MQIYRQNWVESERGWGQRFDGCSLHLTKVHVTEFINDYWATMPDRAPDIYDKPSGDAFILDQEEVAKIPQSVIDELYDRKNGLRLFGYAERQIFGE